MNLRDTVMNKVTELKVGIATALIIDKIASNIASDNRLIYNLLFFIIEIESLGQ